MTCDRNGFNGLNLAQVANLRQQENLLLFLNYNINIFTLI